MERSELRVPAGEWQMLDGDTPPGELIMQPAEPPLPLQRAGWVAVGGWRETAEAASRVWSVVQVPASVVAGSDG